MNKPNDSDYQAVPIRLLICIKATFIFKITILIIHSLVFIMGIFNHRNGVLQREYTKNICCCSNIVQ